MAWRGVSGTSRRRPSSTSSSVDRVQPWVTIAVKAPRRYRASNSVPQVRVASAALTSATVMHAWSLHGAPASSAGCTGRETREPKTVPVILERPARPRQVAGERRRTLGLQAREWREARQTGLVGLFGEWCRRERTAAARHARRPRRRRPHEDRQPRTDEHAILVVDVDAGAARQAGAIAEVHLVLHEQRRRRERVGKS